MKSTLANGITLCVTFLIAGLALFSDVADSAEGSEQLLPSSRYTVCLAGCAYSSIQAALDAAAPGTTVTVAPGIYRERLFLRPQVSLVADNPATTIVSPVEPGPVVTGEGEAIRPDTLVQGLQITGGRGVAGGGVLLRNGASPTLRSNLIAENHAKDGAGLYIQNSSPLLEYNTIRDNRADSFGGGVVIIEAGSAPILRDNLIAWNQAGQDGGGLIFQNGAGGLARGNVIRDNRALTGTSGGIKVLRSAEPQIIGNRILENQAVLKDGGGLYIEVESRPLMRDNIVQGNLAGRFGGAIVINSASVPMVLNNLITGNHAGERGAGVFIRNSSPELVNNTVAHNFVSGTGEAIILSGDARPLLRNNIVVANRIGVLGDASATPTLSYNDVWGNEVNWSGVAPSATDLSVDPRFEAGVWGLHYLRQGRSGANNSPLVDAGAGTSSALGLDHLTTSAESTPDQGRVDLGYHFALPLHRVLLPIVQ